MQTQSSTMSRNSENNVLLAEEDDDHFGGDDDDDATSLSSTDVEPSLWTPSGIWWKDFWYFCGPGKI